MSAQSKSFFERAYAKINISLDVTERRADGYHDMLMVMQSVSLCDELRISLDGGGQVRSRNNLRFIPNDERNLAVKAALRFLETAGIKGQGMLIEMQKSIPVGAGMGGGSSDAAAVLRCLNRIYDFPFTGSELERIGENVGSDVPFCVCGGTALASGRGEKLQALPPMPDCRFVICKPRFSISTPELFRELDKSSLRCHPDTEGIVKALNRRELPEICRRMYNVFEDVDDRRMRDVKEIKGRLLDYGAMGAIMTGTGSAVFGVFPANSDMSLLCGELQRDYGFCVQADCVGRIEQTP